MWQKKNEYVINYVIIFLSSLKKVFTTVVHGRRGLPARLWRDHFSSS